MFCADDMYSIEQLRRTNESLPSRKEHLWLFGKSAGTWAVAQALDVSHPWYFDVMHNRKRWRMPVAEFAIARPADHGAGKPAAVLRFKAVYRKGREVATVNRASRTKNCGRR
jgi:hypothetical protein